MKGWWGRVLRVDLSRGEVKIHELDKDVLLKFMGGRGLAAWFLWNELRAGVDPLSPENKLVLAVGPLTGLPGPSTGKMVIAAKSPLTGGYGDGNIGSWAAVNLKRAGFDAVIIEGRAKRPSYLYIEDDKAYILSAEGLWGKTTFEAERILKEAHGKDCGILTIGPAGENKVLYATIISQEGRSGGRPGMGAVMGSKNLKAIVVKGTKEVSVADKDKVLKIAAEALKSIRESRGYSFWVRQGTMATIEWAQTAAVLPTYNFREGTFDMYRLIDGYSMEAAKVLQRSCPGCIMPCGNVVMDSEGKYSELDYENVAMLGSNMGLGHLGKVAVLNRLADELGLDTISLGNCLGFLIEASEKRLISEKIEWGEFKELRELVVDTAYRRGLGNLLAEGVKRMAHKIGGGSERWAMHVKGLEISAYDCHGAPAMALAYGTSAIGAHHKDAWVISWEVKVDRFGYGREKVAKVIELQRIRGGVFECLVACRLPWVELGLELRYYVELLRAITGYSYTLDDLYKLGDRVYTLIRAFWVREYASSWSIEMDIPPARWFEEPLSRGPIKGAKLDRDKYLEMLRTYYSLRGWDERGIPRVSTLEELGLKEVAAELSRFVELKP